MALYCLLKVALGNSFVPKIQIQREYIPIPFSCQPR